MSFAVTSVALSTTGLATGTIGSYYSAQSNKSSLAYQAQIAEINARLSETSAQQELLKGQHEVGKLTRAAGQLKGRQRVALAANGVDLGVGNAAEMLASTDIMKEIDAAQIEENALRSAWGYRTQGMNYQNEATMKRTTANGISPGMSATTSLLGSAGSVAAQWYSITQP